MKPYLAAFKRCRRSRKANSIQAIIEIIKTIYIITATTFLVKSDTNFMTIQRGSVDVYLSFTSLKIKGLNKL